MIEIRADGCLVRVAGVVGYQHENYRAQIRFPLDDVLDIVRDNPGGSYAVVYKRMFDEQFFTSTDYELDGAYLIWNVSSHVVAVRGDLEVQIVYSTDQQIAETQIYHFKVARGLMEDEEGQGENLSDLIEQALLAAGTVDQAIYDAQQTLNEKVTAAQTAQAAAEAAQTAAERAQHTAENAKTSAAQSANAAYNFAADANTAKRDSVNAKNDAVQAKTDAENAQAAAETAETNAETSELRAEGYAVGAQNGTPAAEGQPYYQDNAKYYKEQATAAKTAAEAARDTAQQTVAGIEAAGTAQVGRVAAEGATQVNKVQTKGQEVLDSIPDDYSELSGEVTNLKRTTNDVEIAIDLDEIELFADHSITTNQNAGAVVDYSNPSVSTSGLNCAVVNCSEGDAFTLFGEGGYTPRLWAFIDSSDKMIDKAASYAEADGLVIYAPQNAAKCIINTTGRAYYGKFINQRLEDVVSQLATLGSATTEYTLSFVKGGIDSSTGNISTTATNRVIAVVPHSVYSVFAKSGYQCALFGWNASNTAFLGCYNGNGFATGSIVWNEQLKSLDVKTIRSTYNVGNIIVAICKNDNTAFSSIPDDIISAKGLYKDGSVYTYTQSTITNNQILVNNGRISSSNYRLMHNLMDVTAGDIVCIKPNGMYYAVAIRKLDLSVITYTDLQDWDHDSKTFVISDPGQLVIMFANGANAADSTTIIPSDYTADVMLFQQPTANQLAQYIVNSLDDINDNIREIMGGTAVSALVGSRGNMLGSIIQGIVLTSLGEEDEDSDYVTSGMIEIPQWKYNSRYNPYRVIYCASYDGEGYSGNNFTRVCFYDASRGFLQTLTENPLTIPTGARYVRVSFPKANGLVYVGYGMLNDMPPYSKYHEVIRPEYIPCIVNAIRNSDGAKTNVVSTALQYYSNTDFGYGNTHTAYSASAEACESDGVTRPNGTQSSSVEYPGVRFQIDCSAFTRLSIQCIYPKYTRHYLSKNIVPPWGYQYNDNAEYDTPEGRLTAHKQAIYAYKNGYLFAIKSDLSNLEAGDLIFQSGSSESDFFDGINHCRLVVNAEELKTGGKRITILEASGSESPITKAVTTSLNAYQHYGARFPLPYAASDPAYIGSANAVDKALTNEDKVIATISLTEPLKTRNVYTLVFNATFDSAENYCIVSGFGDAFNFNDLLTYDGLHYKTIILPVDGNAGSEQITITANESGNVSFGGAKVYKGFYTPSM